MIPGGDVEREANPFTGSAGLTGDGRDAPSIPKAPADPDADLVARVKTGDLEAFETLVARHSRRIYRTLVGITGSAQDAEDSMQEALLQAYRKIDGFRGDSRFSTWLTRIAINEALARLRSRTAGQNLVATVLESEEEDEEGFRPGVVDAWEQNPERLYSEKQMRELVEREILNLPARYRTVVMLRDIEQQSTEETAQSLGLGQATVKTRLLRGRLMLREALAPYFVSRREEPPRV